MIMHDDYLEISTDWGAPMLVYSTAAGAQINTKSEHFGILPHKKAHWIDFPKITNIAKKWNKNSEIWKWSVLEGFQ